ncbi:hypothetical protein ACOSQ2_028792 [Xanthoceras sorbifolium]
MSKKEANHSKKGKSVAVKMPRRTLPKSSRGTRILEKFLKNTSLKRACTSTEASGSFPPEDVIPKDIEPLNVILASMLKEVPSELVQCSKQGSEFPYEFHYLPMCSMSRPLVAIHGRDSTNSGALTAAYKEKR